MIVAPLTGDPESVCDMLNTLIGSGADILYISKTSKNATYIVTYAGGSPPSTFFLLLEDGSYLLQEDGNKFILN